MSKSIKLKNDNYWDSSSIVDDKQTLEDMIKSLNGGRAGGLAKKKVIRQIDLNNLITEGSGLYIADEGCSNTPFPQHDGNTAWHWYIIQICYFYNYAVQIAISVHSDDNHIYMRHAYDNKWRAWLKLTLS